VKTRQSLLTTPWSTTLSSKVNLPQAFKFRAFCGASLVKVPSKLRGNETLILHRVGPCSDSGGVNGLGIYCLQLPSGAEAQYKLEATGTHICIRTRIEKIRLSPRYPTKVPEYRRGRGSGTAPRLPRGRSCPRSARCGLPRSTQIEPAGRKVSA